MNASNIASTHLSTGHTKSCGCLRAKAMSMTMMTHGMSDSKEHNIWQSMRSRCLNPFNRHYADYGGRGITICERWQDFSLFLADMGLKPEGKSLDRIDNNGPYSPDNCIWSSQTEQCRNTRTNRYEMYNGQFILLKEISEQTGIPYKLIHARLARGLNIEQALQPCDRGRKRGTAKCR